LAGLAENAARVVRGGSYNNEGVNLRCAIRNRNNPNNRNDNIGFRVVVCAVSHASLWKATGFGLLLRSEMPLIHG
jgi:hypothetical protein